MLAALQLCSAKEMIFDQKILHFHPPEHGKEWSGGTSKD